MSEELVIAIDGPAGSGKSTVARRVAAALGCSLLDTGAIYRLLALRAREDGVSWSDGPGLAELAARVDVEFRLEGELNRVLCGGRDLTSAIRTPDISRGASQVSALAEVRAALLELQRGAARRGPLVAEGRDMGTVVFPRARVKVFLEADPRVRARRRCEELRAAGHEVDYERVLAEQLARDAADAGREVAPLRPAEDAALIDTSSLQIDEVVARILGFVGAAAQQGRG